MSLCPSPLSSILEGMKTAKPDFRIGYSKVLNGNKHWYIIGRPEGDRVRAWFRTKEEAQAEANERNTKMRKLGERAVTLDHALVAPATRGATLLQVYGKTVEDAIQFYLAHLKSLHASCTGNQLVERVKAEFARRLSAGEISPRHIQSMDETLRKFLEKYGDTNLATVTATDIKQWLSGMNLAIKTRNRHLGYVKNALGIGKDFGLLAENPLQGAELFRDPAKNHPQVDILTTDQLSAFLSFVHPETIPFFTISAFTGLRRAEVERLDWSEVKLERKLIDLPASKSKNHRRKLIEVPDNLLAWLKPHERKSGSVKPNRKLQWVMEQAADKAGIVWTPNVLRHSFCSYAVAAKGFTWTSLQADHSERMLREHYREVVTKQDAEKYWNIRA
jgi:integrase